MMESFKTNDGSSNVDPSNMKGEKSSSWNRMADARGVLSQTNTGSKTSLGVMQQRMPNSGNNSFKRQRVNPRLLHRKFKDTNTIQPNQAYSDANKELQSPSKKRPQSGGPSPDKRSHIEVDNCSESEQVQIQIKQKETEIKEKMQSEVNRIMEDNQNTQEMLQKAKAEIQTTRKQISESII